MMGSIGPGSIRASRGWRNVVAGKTLNFSAASATGYTLGSSAVFGSFSTIPELAIPGSFMQLYGKKFKIYLIFEATGGSGSDPTNQTVNAALHEVTVTETNGGANLARGTQVTGSETADTIPTPRGRLFRLFSSEFTVDSAKLYAMALQLKVAALPASTSVFATAWLLGR